MPKVGSSAKVKAGADTVPEVRERNPPAAVPRGPSAPGKVFLRTLLIILIWSSAAFMPSEGAGFVVTSSSIVVAVSKGKRGSLCTLRYYLDGYYNNSSIGGLGSPKGYREHLRLLILYVPPLA
jgi:hypothetical protein